MMNYDFFIFDEWSELDSKRWREWWASKAGQEFRARFDAVIARECLACLRRLYDEKQLDK